MFEVNNLTIKIKDRYLVKNLSFTLNHQDKLAIIGEEGNGKTTLLKSLLGICEYAEVTGNINKKGNKIGYLKQSMAEEELRKKVYNYLFKDESDYYNKINNLYKFLKSLKLDDTILNQPISTLSGGEKIKISILKLLLNEYDILFLDEPTNDLDVDALNWLEDFINNSNKPIIYVSHDETLLSNTANEILHLEQLKKKNDCTHTLLKINYDTYIEKRLQKINRQTKIARSEKRDFIKQKEKLNRIMQKVDHQQKTITRKDPHGGRLLKKKMHSLKSMENKLNNVELTTIPDVEESINFFFEKINIPKNKQILNLNIPTLKVKNKILAKNIKLNIIGNKHICIIGTNGIGKTTLIKEIYKALKNKEDLNIGYMPQNYEEKLKDFEYVLDFLCPQGEDITKARMYLGNMKFTKEEMEGKIKELSNGTKTKLFLIKLVLDKCNILILDEPTRNISPLSNPVIRKMLKGYTGTIITVSHDRKYIKEVIDTLYVLTKDGLTLIDKEVLND